MLLENDFQFKKYIVVYLRILPEVEGPKPVSSEDLPPSSTTAPPRSTLRVKECINLACLCISPLQWFVFSSDSFCRRLRRLH